MAPLKVGEKFPEGVKFEYVSLLFYMPLSSRAVRIERTTA